MTIVTPLVYTLGSLKFPVGAISIPKRVFFSLTFVNRATRCKIAWMFSYKRCVNEVLEMLANSKVFARYEIFLPVFSTCISNPKISWFDPGEWYFKRTLSSSFSTITPTQSPNISPFRTGLASFKDTKHDSRFR